ncbi:MAG: efflux RND transporter periplasmic adaptor subunit [bacterium]
MTKKKKIWIIVGFVVVILIFIIANLGQGGGASFAVTTEEVERGEIISLVTATGTVQARTTVKISADVSAKIVELPIQEGDQVSPGDLLIQLDRTRYLAAVRQTEAQLAAARADAKRAEASMIEARQTSERGQKLFVGDLISEEQHVQLATAFEVAEANYQSAQYNVAQMEAYLVQRNDDLAKTRITSPIRGTVIELNAEIGEIVMIGTMNNAGTVIMTVADLDTIEVEVEVDETDISHVKVGQEVEIEVDAFPDTTFTGEVTEVGNAAQISGYSTSDRVTNFLVTVLLLDDVPEIKPGMTATTDITVDRREDAVCVPIQAVVYREKDKEEAKSAPETGEGSSGAIAAETPGDSAKDEEKPVELEGVFRVVGDSVEFVPVETGIADQQRIEIVSGLEPGERIVTGSYTILRTIKSGAKITIKESVKDKENKES